MTPISQIARELRPIVDDAIGRGCWELIDKKGRSAHPIRLVHRSGRFIALSKSKASGVRGIDNLRADIRRIEREQTSNWDDGHWIS